MGELTQVSDHVFVVETDLANWAYLLDGDGVTVVDTGYPGHRGLLERTLGSLGHTLDSVSAVIVTHAHVDHLGSAELLRSQHGVPVYLDEAELAHARREEHHALTPLGLALNLWRPGVLSWTREALQVGVTSKEGVEEPTAFPAYAALDLPGRPVPVRTPGHTPGHAVVHLPEDGVVISGDALVTGHPTSQLEGPQLLPAMFDDDRERTVESLSLIGALEADVLVPGHGPLHHGSVREAAELARSRA